MILVVGATGLLGSDICRQLVEQGHSVRGLVRRTSDPARVELLRRLGVELVEGDLKDEASIVHACQGVDSVITTAATTLNRQPGDAIETVDKQGQMHLVDAARAAGVKRFVYISVPVLSFEGAFPLLEARRAVEAHLAQSGMRYTALRLSWFMEVWMAPLTGFDYVQGKARIFGSGEGGISWISVPDVATLAIRCLDNAHAENALLDVGGPEAVSYRDAVAIFEEESGRKFELELVSEAALREQLYATDDPLQQSICNLMLCSGQGHSVNMTNLLRAMPLEMTTVRQYARRVLRELNAHVAPAEKKQLPWQIKSQ
ncbi:SDR family oxidoreductase [Corallococcus sp. AB011P]|uniref:SDR family oxidoreductase n=1 Tax=Corallococcus sp. AB011P TaxID=2316735 RepID=UPI001315A8FF|nr:SDR family oxidoreductase [Corallococcus sp. AB011P]